MLRGYRFLILAACGLALLTALGTGAYFGSLYAPDHKKYQAATRDQSANNDYRGPSESLPDISGVPGPVERAIANPTPATGQDHEKRDLAAQEASAAWAFWMVLASYFSVVVTTIGTILLYKQIKLTREAVEDTGKATSAMLESNEIAREIGRAQTGAHLAIESAECAIGKNTLSLIFAIRNSGVTQALDVTAKFDLITMLRTDNEPGQMPDFESHDGELRTVDAGVCPPSFTQPSQRVNWMAHSLGSINSIFLTEHPPGESSTLTCMFQGYISWKNIFGEDRDMWVSLTTQMFTKIGGIFWSPCLVQHRVYGVDSKLAELREGDTRSAG